MKNIMLLLDTDRHPTPFDILMAYDSGFDAIVPYQEVGAEDVRDIVQDAMFSRGVKGVNSTTIFIGGKDIEKSREILEGVKKSMFPPFEISVIFDPRGGHTTASALIAKIDEALLDHGLGDLTDKNVVILAGTGQVGQLAAKICLSRGSTVTITSRKGERAEGIAKNIKEEIGGEISGVQGANQDEIFEAVKDADIIISAGKAGIQLIPLEMLRKLKRCKIVADVNAVPPLGIEGLNIKDDKREILPGVYGIGALATGDLKYKTETRVLNDARRAKKGVFDYTFAFEKAKELLRRRVSEREVLEFEPLEGKRLTAIFLQKLDRPSEEELEYVRSMIREYDPDFAAEELGDQTIEDFYEEDVYARVFQDAGILIYPVDISEYARTSISAMLDEKKRLADMVAASYKGMEKISDNANTEYIKAYAEALQAEYEEIKEHIDVSVKNSWMVKGILDRSKEFPKDELTCLFIGSITYWRGTVELLKSVGVEVRKSHLIAPMQG
jgi:methylene-tetrahydromethanopterin dehydrogenase